jgi:hypothetical protein
MTDYHETFRRAAEKGQSVVIQNHNPAPQCPGSRNIFAEDQKLIQDAAERHGLTLVWVTKRVAVFAESKPGRLLLPAGRVQRLPSKPTPHRRNSDRDQQPAIAAV